MQNTVSQFASPTITGFAATVPGKLLIGLCATAIVAASAHISFPLWFTPVPLIMTPLAVLGVGLALGPVAGFLTMLAYLAEGAIGLPVFGPQGPGGVAQLFGPTGGYLMAYPFVAAIAGCFTRSFPARTPRFASALIGCTAAIAILFACGAGWLSHFAHLSLQQTWIAAVAPFLPGEAIKIVVAAGIYSTLIGTKRA